ncbi:MFS transporter [Nocardia aurantia]|uniref:Putative transporter n=1 Tax=Nocardia aurantia TaxID=2585199 RepID=A0A7K0E1R4_9NOCA|nr:MFS transporter [Nocardia aurantia]MQY31342.1 putative transporter [Nocardia aurantia]
MTRHDDTDILVGHPVTEGPAAPAGESAPAGPAHTLSSALVVVFAVACGLAAANLYYAQPLIITIASAFHVSQSAAGMVVTVTQLGYAAGLLLVAPLGDLFENRRLITVVMSVAVLALLAASATTTLPGFLAAALAIGLTSVVAQVLVPFAAHLAPPHARGRVVGQVMSGLLTGIVLARSVSGIIAGIAGWRAVYIFSAALLAVMVILLRRILPLRTPEFGTGYGRLLASLGRIYLREPVLRRRAFYQAAMFGSFSVFWTAITLLLARPPFHFSQISIGLFAIAGVLGVFMAPLAGRLGDQGHERWVTGVAFLLAAGSFAVTLWQDRLWALIFGAVFLDLAVQTTLVLGQRAIYALNPAERSRLNTLYIATFFVGGALGSAGAGIAFARYGWAGVVVLGTAFPLAAFVFWLTERKTVPSPTTGS